MFKKYLMIALGLIACYNQSNGIPHKEFADYLAWASRRAKSDYEDDLENIKAAEDFAKE